MRTFMLRALPLFLGLAMAASTTVAAAAATDYQQTLLSLVRPAEPTSFDIGWFDAESKTYYLADRTNSGIDVFDGRTNVFLKTFRGFTGFTGSNETSGPNGVMSVDDRREVWAGDGNSTVKVISTRTGGITHDIPTGGSHRADELADDPRDHLVMIANDADSPPFVTFISTETYKVVAHITYDGGSGPDHAVKATDGLEQPVWDDPTHVFYFAVPATTDINHGEVDVIDPRLLGTSSSAVVKSYAVVNCHPQGLALGPDDSLLLGCGGANSTHTLILNKRTGATEADISQVHGSDEVWFNPGDRRYYLAASGCACPGPVLGVIDARASSWLTNVTTQAGSHSVAANPDTNQVYVPLNGKGVGIYMDLASLPRRDQG